MLDNCWFLKPRSCFILPGRFGDIIQCLSGFHEIFQQNGQRPVVVSSEQYASVYDGVSYVDPIPVPFHWSDGVAQIRSQFPDATVVQWWNSTDLPPAEFRGATLLNCRGRNWGISLKRWPSYGHSMMERIGFPNQRDWLDLPLVFDRRDTERESDLLHRIPLKHRPLLLYNFTSKSSPFGYLPELWPILQSFKRDFTLLDLGTIRCHRVYDLICLYDIAAGLLTCDTATLHLAPASAVPYIAWTQNGWNGSVPRGNCVLHIPYNQTLRRLPAVKDLLEQWRNIRPVTNGAWIETSGTRSPQRV